MILLIYALCGLVTLLLAVVVLRMGDTPPEEYDVWDVAILNITAFLWPLVWALLLYIIVRESEGAVFVAIRKSLAYTREALVKERTL